MAGGKWVSRERHIPRASRNEALFKDYPDKHGIVGMASEPHTPTKSNTVESSQGCDGALTIAV